MKIVTICGSFKFQKEMLEIWEKLFLEGYLKRIEISDAIFVCNIDGYVGESTKNEIEYAKELKALYF